MSRNYYSEINLHVTWHCKDSSPLLTPSVEPLAHREIRHKIVKLRACSSMKSAALRPTFILLSTIPPTLTISEFVGQIKGALCTRSTSK